MRKAQSISINTIIIAAIALIVMIFVIIVFTGNMTNWNNKVKTCAGQGGVCVLGSGNTPACNKAYILDADDCNTDETCCRIGYDLANPK